MLRITFIFLLFNYSYSQIPTGEWRMHVANKALDIATNGTQVFTLLETGLLEYDIVEQETSLWTDVNSLSDIELSTIYFDNYSQSFFVGYVNGNIDRIQNNQVTNIPAIKLASIFGNKKVNSFISKDNFVYAATGLGIVVINSTNNEIKDTYYPNSSSEEILAVAFHNDTIYALTETRVWKSNISNNSLADPAQWSIDVNFPIQNIDGRTYANLIENKGNLLVLNKNEIYGSDTLYKLSNGVLTPAFVFNFDTEINQIKKSENKILFSLYDGVSVLSDELEFEASYNNFGSYTGFAPKNACIANGNLYLADNTYGLFEFSGNGTKLIENQGPEYNSFFALGGTKNKIAVAGGVIKKTTFQYNVSGAATFGDEKWNSFNRNKPGLWYSKNVFDISSVSINPLDENQIAFGSYSEIPLSISNDGESISEVFDDENAPFVKHGTPLHENICVSDIEFDNKGNLWVLNCFSNTPLKVYTKDQQWFEFTAGTSSQNNFSGRMVIDYSGTKWFSVLDEGLFGYNDNNTIEDQSDDQIINLKNSETNGALPDANVTAIAVDFDNEIWIGTSSGFAILYNPDNAFDAAPGEYNAQRIKIDFEGNVEYVLGKTSISDIEVDGGNRKWIGTANAGIFLLSPDGSEVLESFTKENSSLISNNIIDMQFNGKTGELFIITDLGMVSLRTNSSTGDDDYEDVIVFPNPVKPDFDGYITIQGIKYDSDVKFTDAAGNLVYKTTSNGGTATWNGKNFEGEKVKAGTYLIWTASNTESGRKVGKVVILN